jgi:hypothetical protein
MRMPGFTGEFSLGETGPHAMVAAEVRSTSEVMAAVDVTGPLSKWWFTCYDALSDCQLSCLLLPDKLGNKVKSDCIDCCGAKWDWCHTKGYALWGIFWPYNSPPCNQPPYLFSGM